MKNSVLTLTLQKAGLSEKEALIYLAALRLGPSSVMRLARESGVKRSTVYPIVESLKAKNLIRREVRGIKEFLVAEDPERLKLLIEDRGEQLTRILPELTGLYRLEGATSVIKYYDGIESLKQAYRELLRSVKIGDDYLILSDVELWDKLDQLFMQEFTASRGKLDIKVRLILVNSRYAKERQTKRRQPNEQVKLLPAKSKLTTNLVIVPSRVLVHQMIPPIFGMVIENEHLIRMHREMYELIWAGI